jgi:hypothetical protein
MKALLCGRCFDIRPKNEYAHIYADDLAFIVCPQGHRLRVTKKIHRIAADGTLDPSWVCTGLGCSFHVYCQLVGWGIEKDMHEI